MAELSTAVAARGSGAGEHAPHHRPSGGLEQCAESIEGMLGGDPDRRVSMLLLASEGGIAEAFRKAGPRAEIEKAGGALSVRVTGSAGGGPGRLLVVQTAAPQIHLAITDEGPAFVDALPSLLERMHPRVFVPHFTSGEIRSMLELLESETGLALTTTRVTARGRIGGRPAYVRRARRLRAGAGRGGPGITYAGVPYRESFELAAESGQRIDKVQFVLSDGEDVRMEGHLSRGGVFKLRHSFLIFKDHVLPHALGLAVEKCRMYSSRSREDNGGDVSPLVVRLERGTLCGREQNRAFVEAVQGMRYTSSGIYHSGAHVDMSLVDHMDGSTFEIWVVSPDTVTIVPQLRATRASLSRLIAHIFEAFQEGKVLEYEQ